MMPAAFFSRRILSVIVLFKLCYRQCDSFLLRQQKMATVFINSNAGCSTHDLQYQRRYPLSTGTTVLSMGIVEDFVSDTDAKSRNTRNEKYLNELNKRVDRINGLEEGIEDLDDDELQAKSQSFRERLQNGEDINGPILEETFAVVREAAWCVEYSAFFELYTNNYKILDYNSLALSDLFFFLPLVSFS